MLALGWVDDWVWGLLLIAVTLAIHAGGLVMIAVFALKLRLVAPDCRTAHRRCARRSLARSPYP